MPLARLFGHRLVHDLRGQHQVAVATGLPQRLFGACEDPGRPRFDIAVHQVDERILIEAEPHDHADQAAAASIHPLLLQLRGAASPERLCAQIASHFRVVTGFDRTLVYRFHPDGSGEVVAESRRGDMPSFKGLRFPASDIPPQARALYLRNPLRYVADVEAAPVPIASPATTASTQGPDTPIDLSHAVLRALADIHLDYLRNMGLAASLSISLIVDGQLWGFIACHHRTALRLSLQRRSALEFYGQMASSLLAISLREADLERQRAARTLCDGLHRAFAGEAGALDDLAPHLADMQRLLDADGVASFIDGTLRCAGTTPAAVEIEALLPSVGSLANGRVYATHRLATVHPAAAAYPTRAAGLLAIPVSRDPRDVVLFFRRELIAHVAWAGDPAKAADAVPRKNFETWKQTVRNESAPWTDADLVAAETMRIGLIEVLLQLAERGERKRKVTSDHQDLVIAELNHRIRNTLNLVLGLVHRSGDHANSVRDLVTELDGRVHALARAHDQFSDSDVESRSVHEMIRIEASAFLGETAARIDIGGDDAFLAAQALPTLALVVHELITNAAKYGAIRDSHGTVGVHVARRSDGLLIDWQERCRTPIRPPTRRGFGSAIIERAIPHELGGTADIRFEPDGMRARFTVPLVCLADRVAPTSRPILLPQRAASSPELTGRILLVEDNLLIALETESALRQLGAHEVFTASSVASALAWLDQQRPSVAILDYNLGREQSTPVADRLLTLGIPFVFATGYGDTSVIEGRFRNRPILTKPYTARAILDAVGEVAGPTGP